MNFDLRKQTSGGRHQIGTLAGYSIVIMAGLIGIRSSRPERLFDLDRPHAVGFDIGTSTLPFPVAKHPNLLRSIILGIGTAAVPIQTGGVSNDIIQGPRPALFQRMAVEPTTHSRVAYSTASRLRCYAGAAIRLTVIGSNCNEQTPGAAARR